MLEKELESERKAHREKDVEIIRLRAEINGVKLSDGDLQAMMAPVDGKLRSIPPPEQEILDKVSEEEEESEEEYEQKETAGERQDSSIQPEVAGNDIQEEAKVVVSAAANERVSKSLQQASPKASTHATENKEVISTLDKLGINLKETPKAKDRPFFERSPSDYFPLVRRGMAALADELLTKEEDEVVKVGWKHEITSRKEREEALRSVTL
jgi:hypothetical protein